MRTDFKHPLERKIPLGWKVGAWLILCYSIVGSIDFEVAKAREKAELARAVSPSVRPPCDEWLMTKADQERWKLRMCKREKPR